MSESSGSVQFGLNRLLQQSQQSRSKTVVKTKIPDMEMIVYMYKFMNDSVNQQRITIPIKNKQKQIREHRSNQRNKISTIGFHVKIFFQNLPIMPEVKLIVVSYTRMSSTQDTELYFSYNKTELLQ